MAVELSLGQRAISVRRADLQRNVLTENKIHIYNKHALDR